MVATHGLMNKSARALGISGLSGFRVRSRGDALELGHSRAPRSALVHGRCHRCGVEDRIQVGEDLGQLVPCTFAICSGVRVPPLAAAASNRGK